MDISELYAKIIPPLDYQHRNGVTTHHLIDKLSDEEKKEVEKKLIEDVSIIPRGVDDLIVENLVHLKSKDAVPALRGLLDKISDTERVWIASAIYAIDQDNSMIQVALQSFRTIERPNEFISLFRYLAEFKHPDTDEELRKYLTHKDELVRYNARVKLGLEDPFAYLKDAVFVDPHSVSTKIKNYFRRLLNR